MRYIVLTLFIFFISFIRSFSQSLIVGIPSADVAEKQHLELTHESQYNFWDKPNKWNSFNFMCYGIGSNAELTLTLNNLDNKSSIDLALGCGGKKVFNCFISAPKWEHKFILGTNVLYSTHRNDFGFWSYGLYSLRIPRTKTRLTGGLSYGTSQAYGFRTVLIGNVEAQKPNNIGTVLLGFEQPLTKHLSFVADWYSGNHALAAFIPALQYDLGHNVIIFGYKIANNLESGGNAFISELMVSMPTRKNKHKHLVDYEATL